jgi:hypothetical protein
MSASEDAWREAASKLSGDFEVSPLGVPSLRANFGGVIVEAWATEIAMDSFTVATARAHPAARLLLTVRRHHIQRPPLDGAFPVNLGQPAFQNRFEVCANDTGFAQAWMGDNVRTHVANTDERDMYDFTLYRGIVTARYLGMERDPERLVRMVRTVATFANQGRTLFHQWRVLATALRGHVVGNTDTWNPDGVVAINALHNGSPISIDSIYDRVPTRTTPARLYTRVRCRRVGAKLRKFRLVGDQCRDVDAVQAVCGREIRPLLDRVDAHAIDADKKTVIAYLRGLPTGIERIRAAMEIVETLAVGAAADRQGPYR